MYKHSISLYFVGKCGVPRSTGLKGWQSIHTILSTNVSLSHRILSWRKWWMWASTRSFVHVENGQKTKPLSFGKGLERSIFWMNNVGLGLCFVRFFPSLDVCRKDDMTKDPFTSFYRLKDRTDCAISLEATEISKSTSLGKRWKNKIPTTSRLFAVWLRHTQGMFFVWSQAMNVTSSGLAMEMASLQANMASQMVTGLVQRPKLLIVRSCLCNSLINNEVKERS